MSRTDLNTDRYISRPWYYQLSGFTYPVVMVAADHVVEARSGFVTPNFGRFKKINRQSKSDLPINLFNYYNETLNESIDCTYTNSELSYPFNYEESTGADVNQPGSRPPVPWMPDLDTKERMERKVNAACLEKLKDQKANLAQVFAERKMTADLIASTATRLAKSFSSLRRGDIRGAASALGASISRSKVTRFNKNYKADKWKAAANGWLELQYGWRPLLQDVHGSAEWLASKQSHEIRERVSSRQTLKIKDEQTKSLYGWDTVLERTTARYDVSIVAWFSTTGSELASLKEAGITNPGYLMWELLPYSFVVDWFIPIGNYLSSMDATLGLSFQKGGYTYFIDSRTESYGFAHNRIATWGFSSPSRINLNTRGGWKIVICRRVPFYAFPSNNFPPFKNPLSFEHAANAIALLTQTFRR